MFKKLSIVSTLIYLFWELLNLDLSPDKTHALKVNKTMHQKATSAICTIYQDTIFDTKKKALPSVEGTEKGKNKGLPTDFWSVGSPISLLNCMACSIRCDRHKLPIRNN